MMNTNSIEALQRFISSNQLRNQNNSILFDATVTFYLNGTLHSIRSQVQIITLPNEMALYVMDFLKEEYHQTEMYNTSGYTFEFLEENTLQINASSSGLLIASILPA